MTYTPPLSHERIARASILNAVPIPEQTKAVLEARGVDLGELEQRLRHNMGFRK
ncbi:hypothetical protein HU230_0012670 [Bradyrhizobium quebecense]|uniref:Uncharacterized protein n=1 Tax=Bradyrhizobium quebecense TaxID=2748629 RepID=A0A974ACW6_9BRAD|nr:hypothetical protein [Bradyrhizobium quebecense]UGA46843.1 hypothetical protein HU230_0012670 [Bradyrhizobium quebecense]